MLVVRIIFLIFLIRTSHQLNNGLGQTPQMGKIFQMYLDIILLASLKDGTVGIIFLVILMKN
jgi:hypothetical protein